MTRFEVQCGAAELPCEEHGEGEVLLLLHAGVCDRRSFRRSIPALAAHYRVVAYDRRGFGETRYAAEPFCDASDLWTVLEALRAPQAILVGHSQGARIAIDFALAHPDRVRSLALVAPATRGAPPLARETEAETRLLRSIEAAEAAGDLARVNALEAHLWLDGANEKEGRVGGEGRSLFLQMNGRALHAPPPGPERELDNAFERLEQLQMPTHVLLGELDRPSVNARGRAIAQRVRHSTLHCMPSVAHLPPLEQPSAFSRWLIDSLLD